MLTACTGDRDTTDAEGIVKSSPGLSATDRLSIYSRGYVARLRDHLRKRYPMLRSLTGDEVFDLFALAYVRAHPPTSHSIFEYGNDLPDFLDDTRPSNAGSIAGMPAAVARLDLSSPR